MLFSLLFFFFLFQFLQPCFFLLLPRQLLLSPSLHIFLMLFYTFTLSVDPSTLVAELEFAFAGHMVATLILLNPKLAFRALFKFLPSHKLHKCIICCTMSVCYLILFASHIFMPVNSTVKTVLFFALGAFESHIIIFLKEKHILAISGWAPRYCITIHICIEFQSVLLILFLHFFIQDLFDVTIIELYLALIVWAF